MADLTCLIADVSVQMDAFCSQMPHNHCFVLSYSLRVNLSISHLIFFFFSVSDWIAVFNASFELFCLESNVVTLGNHLTHKCLM